MGRRKLTLSIDEDIIKEVKRVFAGKGFSISRVVEEFLKSTMTSKWLEELANTLGYKNLMPLDPSKIPENRPDGMDAAKIVRELRDGRSL